MTYEDLLLRIDSYVALRRALGFAMRSEEKLLKEFARFVNESHEMGPIHAQMALDWACIPSPRRNLSGQASRLTVARSFLAHLRAFVPETEVPGPRLLATVRRPNPYLYSPEELERLMNAASSLGPKNSLRPQTIRTIIGLLASTGLRAGEAIRLTAADVRLNSDPAQIHILQTKFRKSRIVPLHPTTAENLRLYSCELRRLHYDGLSEAFFVSEQGGHLSYDALWSTFVALIHRAGVARSDQGRKPCIHALRHGFAIERMRTWYREGTPVQDLLPTLSVYLGHVQPKESYWYLTATPELLSTAAARFQDYAGEGAE